MKALGDGASFELGGSPRGSVLVFRVHGAKELWHQIGRGGAARVKGSLFGDVKRVDCLSGEVGTGGGGGLGGIIYLCRPIYFVLRGYGVSDEHDREQYPMRR